MTDTKEIIVYLSFNWEAGPADKVYVTSEVADKLVAAELCYWNDDGALYSLRGKAVAAWKFAELGGYGCDYAHYDAEGNEEPRAAEIWTPDYESKMTPLCAACLPEFWRGGDLPDGPWVVYPIHANPPGPKRFH